MAQDVLVNQRARSIRVSASTSGGMAGPARDRTPSSSRSRFVLRRTDISTAPREPTKAPQVPGEVTAVVNTDEGDGDGRPVGTGKIRYNCGASGPGHRFRTASSPSIRRAFAFAVLFQEQGVKIPGTPPRSTVQRMVFSGSGVSKYPAVDGTKEVRSGQAESLMAPPPRSIAAYTLLIFAEAMPCSLIVLPSSAPSAAAVDGGTAVGDGVGLSSAARAAGRRLDERGSLEGGSGAGCAGYMPANHPGPQDQVVASKHSMRADFPLVRAPSWRCCGTFTKRR